MMGSSSAIGKKMLFRPDNNYFHLPDINRKAVLLVSGGG
jgi:hypothetical protein